MTNLLYVLASLWAFGTFAVTAYFIFDTCETVFGVFTGVCIALPLWALVSIFPFWLIHHESGPELATLLKADWHCSAAHTESTTTYVQSGQVLMPMTSDSQVCDQYNRN